MTCPACLDNEVFYDSFNGWSLRGSGPESWDTPIKFCPFCSIPLAVYSEKAEACDAIETFWRRCNLVIEYQNWQKRRDSMTPEQRAFDDARRRIVDAHTEELMKLLSSSGNWCTKEVT